MSRFKFLFMNRYKRLLHQIKTAKENDQVLHLSNGIDLNFVPGHEYDACYHSAIPREDDQHSFVDKYIDSLNKIVKLTVYDCFSGDVRILAVGTDRIFVEIVDVVKCYDSQADLVPGTKYWIEDWVIAPELPEQKNEPSNPDLPF